MAKIRKPRNDDIVPKLFAEAIGTFVMVFVIGLNNQITSLTWSPMAIGLMLAALTYTFSDISGAHFNPSVTLAYFVYGSVDLTTATVYVIVQLLCGFLGGVAYNELNPHIWRLLPESGYSRDSVVVVEFTYTFMLIFVFMNVFASRRYPMLRGLAVGLFVTAGTYGGGDITGAAFNPAVTVGADLSAIYRRATDTTKTYDEMLEPFCTGWYLGAQLMAALVGGWFMGLIRPIPGIARTERGHTSDQRGCTPFMARVLCEFLCSYMVVMNTGLSVIGQSKGAAISMGGMFVALAIATSDVSGGCINPCVTMGQAINRRYPFSLLPGMEALTYVLAQLFAAAAAGVMYTATTDKAFALGPGQGFVSSQAYMVELGGCVLLTIVGVAAAKTHGPVGLAVGIAHMACVVTTGPVSGGSLSPAVSFGVSVSSYIKDGPTSVCFAYMGVQFIGCILAACLMSVAHPEGIGGMLRFKRPELAKRGGIFATFGEGVKSADDNASDSE